MSATDMTASAAAADSKSKFAGIPVKITNHLSVSVEIYDVFNPAATGQTEPYLYTKLGTIAAGATATVKTIREVSQLEAMYTGTVSELAGWYFHQFPIKLMSGTQFSFGNPPPLSYTIADSDRASMIQSFLFHRFAMANPDSALTKNLNAALKSSNPTGVNTFFAGTKNFKNCTLSSWNAVMTWLTMFTSGWQGSYYLYETAPASLPPNYSPTLVGTLNIVSSASANSATVTLCTQDSSGKVQPVSPPQSSDVVMAGDGTMVDKNPGEDVTLTLTPVWMNVTQTTMKNNQPQTTYVAGPTVTGTVAGTNVVSSQTLAPLPSQGQSGSDSSESWQQIFSIICEVVGLIVGLVMIYELAEKRMFTKGTAEEQAKREATSESDYENRFRGALDDPKNQISDLFTQNGSKMATDSAGVAKGYVRVSQEQQKKVLTDSLNEEWDRWQAQVDEQVADGVTPSPAFEAAAQNAEDAFKTAQAQIKNGDLKGAAKTMSDAREAMEQTLTENAKTLQGSEAETLRASSDAINESVDKVNEMSAEEDRYVKSQSSESDDSGFDVEDAF